MLDPNPNPINNEWKIDFVVSNFVRICNFEWVLFILFFFITAISCELAGVFAREAAQLAVSTFIILFCH